MKALSLLQPWASLIVVGAKKWETRPWKPSTTMLYILRNSGLLIHASAKFDRQNRTLLTYPPFCAYLDRNNKLPTGAIIGSVKVGRVIPTDEWMKEFNPDINPDAQTEQAFGNYSSGRWTWEMLEPEVYAEPIPYKGALSIWKYGGPVPKRVDKPEGFV